MKIKQVVPLGFMAFIGLFLFACSSDTSVAPVTEATPISTKHTAVYTGAGSVWTWSLNLDGTFTAVKKLTSDSVTDELNVAGTYETFSTGFYKFTVTTATGTDPNLPVAGNTAFGFSIPGVVLIVKPTDSGGETLVMPAFSGTCPSFPVSFNWVRASVNNVPSIASRELWGNATIESATALLSGKEWTLDGGVSPLNNPPTFTGCTDGRITFSGGHVTMTSGGVGIVNFENSGDDIIAFPRDTTITEATIRNRSYVVLAFNDYNDGTYPVNITFPATGDGTYQVLANVTTGAVETSGVVSIASIGTGEQAGFARLVADASSTSPPTMWAAVSTINGRTVFFASGYNRKADGTAATGANDNFSLIAVQK